MLRNTQGVLDALDFRLVRPQAKVNSQRNSADGGGRVAGALFHDIL